MDDKEEKKSTKAISVSALKTATQGPKTGTKSSIRKVTTTVSKGKKTTTYEQYRPFVTKQITAKEFNK